jgi:Mg2+-importing ATPase
MGGLLARLDTTQAGLDSAAARSRLERHGPNDATAEKHRPLVLQFLARFCNPLIIILLVASVMSAATGDVPSFVIIAAIVLLSIGFDFVQEVRARNAVEALRRSVAVQATVRRNGARPSRCRSTSWSLATSLNWWPVTLCPPIVACWKAGTSMSTRRC